MVLTDKSVSDESNAESILKEWKKQESQKGIRSSVFADTTNCNLDQAIIDEIDSYQDVVNDIIELFLTGSYKGLAYDVLTEMTDRFGPRLTGTQALEDTIDWILNRASFKLFDHVLVEPVTAPHWVRNNESLFMTSPLFQELPLLGLGSSIGTPVEGVSAEILVVTSFDDLADKAELADGKIIVYNVPFVTYAETVEYRISGAVEAAKVGGIASIIRSITPFSIDSPHTGLQIYSESETKIPSACITVEDAEMLSRLSEAGETVTLHLIMGAENLGDVQTRNTIIEIEGSTYPEEVVVVSGHIDSWDVGMGAMDDGGGSTISFLAGEALLELNLRPKRTFRTVLFTAEEQDSVGGTAYFLAHANETQHFQLMMESDFGTFSPEGIEFSGVPDAVCMMSEIVSLTTLLGTEQLFTPAETPDLGPFGFAGVPIGSLRTESDQYFWFHHSAGDTMAVQDSDSMDRVTALWTSVAYVLADVSFRLPQI